MINKMIMIIIAKKLRNRICIYNGIYKITIIYILMIIMIIIVKKMNPR